MNKKLRLSSTSDDILGINDVFISYNALDLLLSGSPQINYPNCTPNKSLALHVKYIKTIITYL